MTAATPQAPAPVPAALALQTAIAHHQAGRLGEAEGLYRAILQAQPNHADANHNLGVLALQTGRGADSLPFLQAALAANPRQGQYAVSYAAALLANGQADDALGILTDAMRRGLDTPAVATLMRAIHDAQESARAALDSAALDSDDAALQKELRELVALFQAGSHGALEQRARLLLTRQPEFGFGWKVLGLSLQAQGHAEAVPALQRAAELLPGDAEAHYNLGVALKDLGKLDDAAARFRRALARKPDYAEAHCNLGVALKGLGQLDGALASYRRALDINPGYAEAHSNLGSALADLGRIDEALVCYRRALEIKPDFAMAHNNLGNAMAELGRFPEALAAYRRALEIAPASAMAHNNLGNALTDLGRFDDAVASFERALQIKPDYAEVHANMGNAFKDQGKLAAAIACFRAAIRCAPDYVNAWNNLLMTMVYAEHVTADEMAQTARLFGQRIADPLRRQRVFANLRDPGRKLRIGYVSADFRDHALSYFIEPVLAAHDRSGFELHAYAGNRRDDAVSHRLKPLFDRWTNTVGLGDEQLASQIEADQIDILIDLAGHSAGNRLLALARKPAPVQATWLGYPATTGMAAIDWRISDVHAEPVGLTEQYNVEALWRLPEVFCCYRAPRNSPPVASHPPLQDNGHATFGCLNNYAKVSDAAIALWARILRQTPGARLLLEIKGVAEPVFRADVERRFARHGVDAERLLLIPYQRANQYVLYARIDIALDPFPCNGGTTTLDTLWMGVPPVTLAGRHFVARMGVTLLANVGLPQLIAATEDEYVAIASALAADPARLAQIRSGLRQRLEASPLMDAPRFAKHLEQAYRGMWQTWLAQDGQNTAQPGLAGQSAQTRPEIKTVPSPSDCERVSTLFSAARYAELESLTRGLLADYPESGFVWKALGASLQAQGKEALPALLRATELLPDDPSAHSNLGIALRKDGQIENAVASYRRALAIQPDFAGAHGNLGNALKALGQLAQAVASYRRALASDPGNPQAHSNLALALADLGQLDEAVASFRHALEIDAGNPEVLSNLGVTLASMGRFEDAVASYRNALELKPDYAKAHSNLGNALSGLDRHGQAVASLRRALEIDPGFAEAHSNLGNVLTNQGKTWEALACYRKAIDCAPDHADAWSNLLLAMVYEARVAPAELAEVARQFGRRIADPLRRQRVFANRGEPGRKLKIGYVSADLRAHAVSYFVESLFALHDRSQFELHAYVSHKRDDAVSLRLRPHFDHWTNIAHSSDEQAADLIEADRIDILIDLSGHTAGNRLLVFARKPAPVQATWLGYPASTGLSAMDWRISDIHVEPPGMTQQDSVEALWRLPDVFCCYRASQDSPQVIDHPPARDNGYPTFGCFNNFTKVTDAVIALWARVLQHSPGARLMLEIRGVDEPVFRAEVVRRFTRHGVQAERLDLVPRKRANQYVLYNKIDIALDPFPCNGGTTSFDTLWMGVPLVTLAGGHFVSRIGVALLTNVGLAQLVAASEDEYVAIASGLANDPARLAQLRSGLRQRVQASPLMDAPRFTRHLEQAYRAMWRQWLERDGQGETDDAQPQEKTAEAQHADPDPAQINQLVALFQERRFAEGEAAAAAFAARHPAHPFGWKVRGLMLRNLGRLQEAEQCYQHALMLAPQDAELFSNLAACQLEQKRHQQAADSCEAALRLNPANLGACINLGNALKALGQLAQAVASFRRALASDPGNPQVHSNLALALVDLGQLDEAVASFRRALEIEAGNPEVLSNLGAALASMGRFEDAVASYRKALELKPDYAMAHSNLGNALSGLNLHGQAEASLRRALEIDPGFAEAHSNLGNVLANQSKTWEALACFRKAIDCAPGYVAAWNNLLFAMVYEARVAPAELAEVARQFGRRIADPLRRQRVFANRGEPGRKLKIGYVSADLRAHAVSYFVESLFEMHDRSQFELHAYVSHKRDDDAVSLRLRPHFDHWNNIAYSSDEQAADQIEADQIDILIDLSGHTAGNRLLVFARKPAPVQATWLGYPASTGLSAMDWRISDIHAEPPGMTEQYSVEALWRLPDVFCCYRAPQDSPQVIDHPPARDNGYPTFGCFNNFTKVTDAVIALWARVLLRSPGARLMLEIRGVDEPVFRAEVVRRFTRHGVQAERLDLVPRRRANQYVLYNKIDIALDPFPCNGGTTSFDTLWMGVPLVALAGAHFVSRMGVALLTNVGLAQLVAASEDEYVAIASGLANDPAKLAQIRSGLRQRVQASPLMDAQRFTRHLEQAYHGMWQAWLAQQAGPQGGAAAVAAVAVVAMQAPPVADPAPRQAAKMQVKKAKPSAKPSPKEQLTQAQCERLVGLFNAGRHTELEDDARALLAECPQSGFAWKVLGLAQQAQGNGEAVAAMQKAAQFLPGDAEAHYNLGVAQKDCGQLAPAAASFRRALKIQPGHAAAHGNLGIVLKGLGQLDAAMASYRRALALKPDFAEAHCNLGNALSDSGRFAEAAESFQRALALKPDFAMAHSNLGNALAGLGQLGEAVASYRRALALDPGLAMAHSNLGNALTDLGQLDGAVESYGRALQIAPEFAEAHSNLGNALNERGQSEQAAACFRRALEIKPDYAEAHYNLGNVLKTQSRLGEALDCYRKAIQFQPHNLGAWNNLLLAMVYAEGVTPTELAKTARQFGQRIADPLRRRRDFANPRDGGRKLRIGYVSADLRQHAVSFSIEPVLEAHDRSQFELYAYAADKREDAVSQRLKPYFACWRNIADASDEQLAEQIETDRIDILVDLSGHTSGNRLLAFARKPAPVQVAWLGYPASTGMAAMDYRISDIHAEPPGMTQQYNVETLWRLPEVYCCYRAPQTSPPVIDHPPLQDNGYPIFGCFNNFSKVTDAVIALWARVLEKTPGARLMLEIRGVAEPAFRALVLLRFARCGIDAQRLLLVPFDHANQYVLYNKIDIALDPFPCNGGTTSLDTLWMGVPLVTLAGGHFVSRIGVTLLVNAGLPQLVAASEDEYVAIASGLANDPARLAQLRSGLRQRVQASPLMDAPRFTRHLEQAYRAMWQRWLARGGKAS